MLITERLHEIKTRQINVHQQIKEIFISIVTLSWTTAIHSSLSIAIFITIGVMVFVVGNGHGDMSSIPGRY